MPVQEPPEEAVDRPFGSENRARLLGQYFSEHPEVTAQNAWEHAYRLLMWIDRTTGLAHCYESDKSQAGRPWYARSLAFHSWLSEALGVAAGQLGEEIDVLFRNVTHDLAAGVAVRLQRNRDRVASQRQPYEGQGIPLPNEDPRLDDIILESLSGYLAEPPPPEVLRGLTERIQIYVGQENKRKNLVGEGFEDTVAALLTRVPGISDRYDIRVRTMLQNLPGFHPHQGKAKPKEVDVSLVNRATGHRTLVSCKWSVRADREEQFGNDFNAYVRANATGEPFGYVLVTNEFDPARLAAACDSTAGNTLLFTDVVHVNPDGARAVYSAPAVAGPIAKGMTRALQHADSGRLSSLELWLAKLAGGS
ncbi:hypothetical protein BL253_36085 [Pseudofrankia asymbiotica]|uniref:Uncharacterized protein n=1 Tax=Pseudofrankia asymbiotica TaxID=1834516 RepID=A0A1V2HZK2_9ACTN|nr:hypothetical protein BL253_36085 [Pseudofrankia asymbiotica]